MIRAQGVIGATLALTIANGLSSILGLIRGFYIARFLLPAEYGVWSLISALLNYANYADVGLNTGMLLEVPKLKGQGRQGEALGVQRQVYTATLIVCGAVALLLVLISFMSIHSEILDATNLRIVAAAVLVLGLLNYYNVVARIQERFGLIGLSTLLGTVLSTAGVILVGSAMNGIRVEIVVLISVLGFFAATLLLSRIIRLSLVWRLDWVTIHRLMKIGLPLSLLPIVLTLFQSVDRWIVAMYVPAEVLGYYGLGVTIGLFIYMLPNAMATVLFTRQIERFGATGDPRASESLVSAPLMLSGYTMALVAGGVALVVPFIIHYLLPSYRPGTRAAILQVMGNSLLFAVPISSNFLISIGHQRTVFWALSFGMIVEMGLVALLVQTDWAIDGAALAVLLSDTFYAALITFLAISLFGGTVFQQLRRVVLCFAPFAICLFVAALLMMISPLDGLLWNDLNRLAVQSILYLLICVPLCLLMAWMSGLSVPTSLIRLHRANIS